MVVIVTAFLLHHWHPLPRGLISASGRWMWFGLAEQYGVYSVRGGEGPALNKPIYPSVASNSKCLHWAGVLTLLRWYPGICSLKTKCIFNLGILSCGKKQGCALQYHNHQWYAVEIQKISKSYLTIWLEYYVTSKCTKDLSPNRVSLLSWFY